MMIELPMLACLVTTNVRGKLRQPEKCLAINNSGHPLEDLYHPPSRPPQLYASPSQKAASDFKFLCLILFVFFVPETAQS